MKLEPVIYNTNDYRSGSKQTAEQFVLLKALQVTQDPKELRKMMGVKTVTDVYRTLDKLSMRREYHEALANAGVSFEFLVSGLKTMAEGAYKDGDKIKAFQILLKSLGLDKYEADDAGQSGTWEETLLKTIEKEKTKELPPASDAEYAVVQPEIPERMRKMREEETEVTKSIYG